MPDVLVRIGHWLAAWWSSRVKTVVLKAPREAPDLLFLVLVLAVVLVILYISLATHA